MAAEINANMPRFDISSGDSARSQSAANRDPAEVFAEDRKASSVKGSQTVEDAVSETMKEQRKEQAKESERSEEERAQFLQEVADSLNESPELGRRDLQFSVNTEADKTVIKVVDSNSGDLIRQIPSEEIVRFAERLREDAEQVGQVVGMLIDSRI